MGTPNKQTYAKENHWLSTKYNSKRIS